MTVLVWLRRLLPAALLVLSISGCMPGGRSDIEEEKEPHFLAGKNAINGMDYRGAIAEFEKALEVNPRNSKAHAQLGWLYEEKEEDAAAAIYHYERYLKLRPNSDNAEVIRQRINNCKQDLAKTVLPLPITPGMQRQFDQLMDENRRLREENEKWKAYFAARPVGSTNPSPVQHAAPTAAEIVQSAPASTPSSPLTGNQPVRASVRTHVVKAGETPASIARLYNVRLSALLAANPTLEPRRMRVGQVVNVPTQGPN